MKRMLATALALSFALPALATFTVRRAPEPSELVRLWPEDAPPPPPTLRQYKKTDYGQYIVIRNGADYHAVAHKNLNGDVPVQGGGENGNSRFPWAVPGGTDNTSGVTSLVGVALPEGQRPTHWKVNIDAGASRPLPKDVWGFPVGTRFYDLLLHRGKPFELRMLKKGGTPDAPRWKGHVLWESGDWPAGYAGVTKGTPPPHLRTTGNACTDCHSRAGGWERYGPLVRGNDFIFSWTAYVEGTNRIDPARASPWR